MTKENKLWLLKNRKFIIQQLLNYPGYISYQCGNETIWREELDQLLNIDYKLWKLFYG